MKHARLLHLGAKWGLVSIWLAGCGGPYDATVSGRVMLDGTPLERGTVAYHPEGSGPSAYGLIDSDGSYAIRTGRELGLPSGQYRATVVANEPSGPRNEAGGPPPPGKPITPPWYRSKETSGLSYQVEPGSNTIDLELTSQPPPGWKPTPGRR